MNKIYNIFTNKIIGYIFIVFMLCIILAKSTYLFELLPPYIAVAGVLGILGLVILVFKFYDKIIQKLSGVTEFISKISYKKMIIIISITSLATKFLAIFLLNINSINNHPDINVYVTTSNELVNYGTAKTFAEYCFDVPHMFWYAVFLSPVTKLFGISQTAFSIYLSIISTISVTLLFDTVSYNFSKNKAFIIFFIFVLLPSQILLPSYVTHENALLFFISISIWLYFKVLKSLNNKYAKLSIYLLFLINLFFCSQVNTAGLLLFIAFFILFLVDYLKHIKIKKFILTSCKCISLLLVLIIGTALFNYFQLSHSDLKPDYIKNDTVLWSLYVGSNYENKGGWSNEDAETWISYDNNYTEKQIEEYHKNLLGERYINLIANPSNLFNLLINKFSTTWSNFNYSIGFSNDTITNKTISNIYNKVLFKPLTFIDYSVSLLIVIIGFYLVLKHRKENKNDFYLLVELYLMGFTLMLMITECMNKYTISLQPFIIIASLALISNNYTNNKNILPSKRKSKV